MKTTKLSRIIRRVDDLPTLPRTILKITEIINNPKSSAKSLAGVITDDQVLTARLLKLVNSSFYGFPQRISTITTAIVLLGFDAIRNLLLTTSVFDMFSNSKYQDKFKVEEYWNHSLGCAIASKIIGNYLRHDDIEELFVAGLLHDIGKVVAMLFLSDEFAEIDSIVKERNILIVTAEEMILGYTHVEIGSLLAKKWNLPSKLENIIAHHHKPESAGRFLRETAIIHLADIISRAVNMGSGGDNRMPALNKDAWNALQLQIDSIEPVMNETKTEFEEISEFLTHSI